MKKPIILSLTALLCAATVSFSQTTTGSTDQASGQNKQNQSSQSADQSKAHPTNPSVDQNKKTSANQSNDRRTGSQATTGSNATGESNSSTGSNSSAASTSSTSTNKGHSSPANEVNSSARPGGGANENANDVGRYSENEDSKSLLNSKEAIERRNKNLTESDTVLKKGSGSAPKNMKNHTGKTSNYNNEATKHNQKRP